MSTISPNKAVTDVKQSPNYSAGRPAGSPNVIVIHHWGVDGQSHQGVVDYLCRSGGNTSAHYVASAGRRTQIVSDRDRAWHAGASGNPRGIGIECRPEMTAGDFESVAQLVAAIRDEHGPLPLRGHQDYMSTACPGRWYSQLARLSTRADEIRAGKTTSTATTPAKPAATSSAADRALDARTGTDGARQLAISGVLGSPTLRRLQEVMGVTITTSGTPAAAAYQRLQRFLDGAVSAGALRTLTGATRLDADGVAGPKTWKAFQYWSAHKSPQWMRQSGGPADLNGANWDKWVDGIAGPNTIRMLQHMLNSSYANSGKLLAK
ncbi:N-acetylmuramoyl-L-alanine amidase [Actinomyces qiguomingii]|uniref:peptidoglycan recognition protein family protein n=1 Tax=Actinomyces qiguomingii TaxID=2057800 RepID=UPI000CA0643E|nr:peptidoglycan recognition family protein [Actinomyces qiguomingii]